jgi:hypothetical protein
MQNLFSPHDFKGAEYKRSLFRFVLPQSFTKEDLEKSENWINIAKDYPDLGTNKNNQSAAMVEVIREDNAFFALVLITGRIGDNLFVKIIHFCDLEGAPKELGDIEVLWKGPARKFAAIRKTDNKELKSGFSSKEEAQFWIKNYY